MKILVMGAGIIGVSTAWHLAQAGHEVIVLERGISAAMETSHANAGMLSYGYSTPWASSGLVLKALKWIMRPHSPLIVRPDGSIEQLQWIIKMLAHCTEKHYQKNKACMERISQYSRQVLQETCQQTGIEFEGRNQGTIQVFRSQKEVDAVGADIKILSEHGVPFKLLQPKEIVQYEPAMAKQIHKLKGALYLPDDATGDCYLFTTRLAQLCSAKGVQFLYNHQIDKIEYDHQQITGVYVGKTRFTADHYVCALGSFSQQLLKQINLKIPVYPIKGYSITLALANNELAPQSTVLDETYKIAITRFNERIRVGGMAELSGYDLRLPEKHRQTLLMVVNDLFPESYQTPAMEFWAGLRPTTPDSVPIIGKSRYKNLSLNTGHGTLGWTMGQGSGKLLADLISGVKPSIEYQDLSAERFQ